MDFYIVIPGNTPWETHASYSQAIKKSIGVLFTDVDPPLHVDGGAILFAKPGTVHIDNSMLPAILARQSVVIEIDGTQGVLSEPKRRCRKVRDGEGGSGNRTDAGALYAPNLYLIMFDLR